MMMHSVLCLMIIQEYKVTQKMKNIIIKNGISRKRISQAGFFLRLMTGSWCNWEKGNKYKVGNTVNYQHNQYKKLNKGECISIGSPHHSKGDSLYSDGIAWRYIGKGINKTSNIYNIYVKNVQLRRWETNSKNYE